MTSELSDYLSRCERLAEESVNWSDGAMPLRLVTHISAEEPPIVFISSARAIVFRGDEVLVIRDVWRSAHILPGGRCEPGESVEETLRREVQEETGWTITGIKQLGVLHYHHLAPKPLGYRYPHPDFLQVISIAHADMYDADAREVDGYELEAEFHPISELAGLGVSESQQRLVEMARDLV